jgi:non-specific serine/threonine protein kinase
LLDGKYQRACAHFEKALVATDDPTVHAAAMALMGWALEFQGDVGRGLVWREKALAVYGSLGESVYRSSLLWSIGIGWWRHGEDERAEELLKESLQLSRLVDDPRHGAACLEALAWVVCAKQEPRRAAVLMAAAHTLGGAQAAPPVCFPIWRSSTTSVNGGPGMRWATTSSGRLGKKDVRWISMSRLHSP